MCKWKVQTAEEEARALAFWDAFRKLSEAWTRKTGRSYYVKEQPSRNEILEVMSCMVEAGEHKNAGAVVEAYYALRRSNFVKYFAKMAEAQARGEAEAEFMYEMSVSHTGWWDVSMPFQVCLICGTVCIDGEVLGASTWNETATREQGYAGMMVEAIGIDYCGSAQVPTMADGTFQVMAQYSSSIHIKVMAEFAEEEFGPYSTEESGAIMSVGRFNLVQPSNAWPTVLTPARGT